MSDTEELARRGQQIPEDEREAHGLFAVANGFFWAPCVLCGREWGGHEWRDIDGKPSQVFLDPDEPTTGTGICPQCTRDGKGEQLPGIVCFCTECLDWRGAGLSTRRGPCAPDRSRPGPGMPGRWFSSIGHASGSTASGAPTCTTAPAWPNRNRHPSPSPKVKPG